MDHRSESHARDRGRGPRRRILHAFRVLASVRPALAGDRGSRLDSRRCDGFHRTIPAQFLRIACGAVQLLVNPATMKASMTGSILQISVSRGGLPKRPIAEGDVTPLGITGDNHAHPQFHGGPRQALLLITSEGVDELIAQGFPLFYGALGENITTRGVDRRWMRAGQRYRIGQIVVELTKQRAPCHQLDVYGVALQDAIYDAQSASGDATSSRWGLSGFYASVLQPGAIRPGDPIHLLEEFA